jgi:hypothetical protein
VSPEQTLYRLAGLTARRGLHAALGRFGQEFRKVLAALLVQVEAVRGFGEAQI